MYSVSLTSTYLTIFIHLAGLMLYLYLIKTYLLMMYSLNAVILPHFSEQGILIKDDGIK